MGLGPYSGTWSYPFAIAGNLFTGGNQAAVATALPSGITETYTGGLILANPIASQNNLIVMKAKCAFVVAQTNAAAISLGVGYDATTNISGSLTAITALNCNPASSVEPSGVLYSQASATLPAEPYLARLLGSVATGALTTEVDAAQLEDNVNGAIVLPPGAFALFLSSAAGTASSFLGSFTWLEQPASATAG